MADPRMLRLVLRDFGPAVIAWTCNLSDEEVDNIARTGIPDERRARVLDRLIEALFTIRMQAAAEGLPAHLLISELSRAYGVTDRDILNVWREEAGGELPSYASDDEVLEALQHLAIDAYPALLMLPQIAQRDPLGFSEMLTTPVFRHPARRRFESAILRDQALALLFPTRGDNAMETYGYVTVSTGRGGSLQLVGLATRIIQTAYALMRMRGPSDLGALFNSARAVIGILREASSGKVVAVPAFVGFNNISLEVPFPIEIPWGILKPYTDIPMELVPSEAHPASLNDEGTSVSLGFVLETSFQYQVVAEPWQPGPSSTTEPAWPSRMKATRQELADRCEQTALMMSLAIERDPPVATAQSWTMILDPLFAGHGASWRRARDFALDPYRVRGAEVPSILDWASILSSVDDSKIRIAQRRTLSASSQRLDPADGFIDAVVAWENLFGAGQGELVFRISAAMASLLSHGGEDRLRLQREISGLYNRRSGVLHGDIDPSPEAARQDRNRALALVLAALRRLYRDLPHLVAEKDRGKVIILTL